MYDFNDKLEIDYPCLWRYKIIGLEESLIREAVEGIVGDQVHTVTFSNTSSGGKYVSLNLELTVANEDHQTDIFENLKNHPHIRMVL